MAAAFVRELGGAAAAAAGATVTMTAAAASTAGNAIVVVTTNAAATSQTITSVTDSKGNTYTQQAFRTHTNNTAGGIWMARNTTALTTSDTISVTWTNAGGLPAVTASEFSGLTGGQDATVTAESVSGSTYDTGSTTVPSGPHLLLSLCAATGTRTFTPSGSGTWTALTQAPDPAATIRRGTPFYQIVSGGGTLQNTGTVSGSTPEWVAMAAAIPAASGLQAPTGLTATPVSTSQIDVSWTAAAGATGYDLERDGAVIATQTGTSYSDTGLGTGTQYTYRVRTRG